VAIIKASETDSLRDQILGLLSKVSKERELRILDAGGGIQSWLGELVTHIIDINPQNLSSKIDVVVGDLNDETSWSQFGENQFDFVSCTHTLEDIRDPKFVLRQISRVGRSGFVAIPNRISEFRNIETKAYLGYAHHRWIFHLGTSDKLQAVAKWIGISNNAVLREYYCKNRIFRKLRLGRGIGHLPRKLIQKENNHLELGIIWIEDIKFEYFNHDFAGESKRKMQESALDFLSSAFAFNDNQNTWIQELESHLKS
jgi:hypothetical protein